MKATYGELTHIIPNPTGQMHEYIPSVETREIFKDPITDDGTKKSAKGLLRVNEIVGAEVSAGKTRYHHIDYEMVDQQTWEQEAGGALDVVFEDGRIIKEQTLEQIRERLNSI